jgi:WD40 repeat protein/tetratricopeptide (TPR) repeat protein
MSPLLTRSPGQPVLPGYEILRELRRDGLGTVYEARQTLYGRLVALRVIADEAVGGAKDLTPFTHAGRQATRLQHPNIAATYEAGNEGGLLYLAAELPAGESLKHRLADALPPAPRAAELVETLARAVAYAHGHHVLHLDLHPGCVFLGDGDTPRIADFGLSPYLGAMPEDFHPDLTPRHVESRWGWEFTTGTAPEAIRPPTPAPTLSRAAAVGNPAYVAPEQIDGPATAVGPATDVYGLGAILYEALTGRSPFFAATPEETRRLSRSRGPLPPTYFRPTLPHDLEAICLKCLSRRPERRYATAEALADDLRRFLDGRPVQVWPRGPLARAWRWCRLNPVAAAVLPAACALFAVILAVSVRSAGEARHERDEAIRARDDAEEREGDAHRLRDQEARLRTIAVGQAGKSEQGKEDVLRDYADLRQKALTLDKNLRGAIRERDEANEARTDAQRTVEEARRDSQVALARRGDYARLLVQARTADGLRRLDGGDLSGALVGFADALRLAEQEKLSEDALRLRLAAVLEHCPRIVQLWSFDKRVNQARLSPDGKRVLTASADGTATLWDAATGARVGEPLHHESAVSHAAFSPDGKRVLTATAKGTVHLWEIAGAKEIIAPMEFQQAAEGVAFSPDGKRFLTVAPGAGEDPTEVEVRVWDAASGEAVGEQALSHRRSAGLPVFSPDGRRVLTAPADRTARVWDPEKAEQVGAALEHGAAVNRASFSADGRRALTAGEDGTARVWDVATGKPVTRALRHGAAVKLAAFSPDGRRVLTVGADRVVRVWDVASAEQVGLAPRIGSDVRQVAFSPDGRHLLTASADGLVQLWDAFTGEEALSPLSHAGRLQSAAFTPQGTAILTHVGSAVRLWDLTAGVPPTAPAAAEGMVKFAAFSPDGKLAARKSDTEVEVYDLTSGKRVGEPLKHMNPVETTAFSPDGRRVLTVTRAGAGAEAEGRVRIWDAASGKMVGKALEHLRPVHVALFSPDGKRVLTASGDKKARLWDAETGEQIGQALDQDQPVTSARFSPDGARVLVAEADGRVRIYETATANRVGNAMGHALEVTRLEFSKDGRRVLTASDDGTARVWDAETGQPVTDPLRHEGPVTDAAFSPDGSRVATASSDGTARIWDPARGRPVVAPLHHPNTVALVAFSADGKRLATASGSRARVWDAATGEPLGLDLVQGGDDQPVNYLAFTPAGDLVTAAGSPGDPRARRTWSLKPDGRPPADLLRLAEVLAGQRPDDAGRFFPIDDADLAKAWHDLRAKYAADLSPSPERALAWDRRGASECERHQLWEGAVRHLDRLVEAKAGGWELYARRATALVELKRWEPAAADYARAVEQAPDRWELWSGRATANAHLGRWEQVAADLTKATDLRPRDAELWARLGRAEAERDRWEQAAAGLNKAIKLGFDDVGAWQEDALLALARGDTKGYQRSCAGMARRFGGSQDEAAGRALAWTCALAGDAVADLKPVLERAERTASKNPASAADLRALAALLYRTGDFEAALRRAQEAMKLPGQSNDPACGFLLAMIHQRLGKPDEAKDWLAKASGWADEAARAKPGGATAVSWSRRLEFKILRREAEALVKEEKP